MPVVSDNVEIPFLSLDLDSVVDPIPAIVASMEFENASTMLSTMPLAQRSLISSHGAAILYTLVRNLGGEHVVEIGSAYGGTTEVLARAVAANGRGLVHTVGPFDSERFLPEMEKWPDTAKNATRFYPVPSMSFYIQMERSLTRPDLVFVDGNHDYEYALFDILCAAKGLQPRGFIVIDNISQAGPYYAAIDFLQSNPTWTDCTVTPRLVKQDKAFDSRRTGIPGADFIVIRKPADYIVNERFETMLAQQSHPHSSASAVKIKLAQSNRGTLFAQCVLRSHDTEHTGDGFQEVQWTEREVTIKFPKMIEAPEGKTFYTTEIWLSWIGTQPLRLLAPPEAL